jgi:magnesium-transporting ATPase (P-type)
MSEQEQTLAELQHIKKMMERSSRFISLSGLSGIAAGICALIGAWFAFKVIGQNNAALRHQYLLEKEDSLTTLKEFMGNSLFTIALYTLIGAFVFAFLFTYLRSRRNNAPIWGSVSKRLIVAVAVPLIAGSMYLFKEMQLGNYGLIAPGSLIFYGLALVNGSKYTLGEIKYLGYAQIILGMIGCWMMGYGLYFWAVGFGILHIVYGLIMWYKYERA